MKRQSLANDPSSSIDRGEFIAALNLAKVALGKATFVPVLSHFCLTGSTIEAFNDTLAVSVAFDTKVVCAVPGDLLLKLLTSLTAPSIALDLKDGAAFVVGGRSRLKLPYLGEAAFAFKDAFKLGSKVGEFEVTDDFVDGLGRCLISVGTDPTHPAQLGVTLTEEALFSTNNVTMSRFLTKVDYTGPDVLLPAEFCQHLASMFKAFEGEKVELCVHGGCVVAYFGNKAMLFSKVMSIDKPLDFKSVFDRMCPKGGAFEDLPAAWESSFTRAVAVVDDKSPTTRVQTDQDVVFIETVSAAGEVEDRIEAPGARAERDFLVDPSHVLRATKVCKEVQYGTRALIMRDGRFSHLITHCAAQAKK